MILYFKGVVILISSSFFIDLYVVLLLLVLKAEFIAFLSFRGVKPLALNFPDVLLGVRGVFIDLQKDKLLG